MFKICPQPHLKNAKEGEPTTLNSPNTHPSFPGRECPLPCGETEIARACSREEQHYTHDTGQE